ncbi:MAG TPA: OmpA family protein [Thermoanaerobaculia bacterium]|nr:OmpA family protein [Thermoanaerobaculia bacterium]
MRRLALGSLLLAFALHGQQQAPRDAEVMSQAQQALAEAEKAGAREYATTLFEEASWRIRFAQENWDHAREQTRNQARLRALEAMWASRAAAAKSNWLATNAAVRSLQGDITRLGGRMDVRLAEESPSIALGRGGTSKERIDFAQRAVDQAMAAGGEQHAGADLKTARDYLESARRIARANESSDTADYLAYVSEMMARRAYYLARTSEASRHLAPLQLERTRLAHSESERRAAEERAQREQAERQAADLQQQLRAEQANRQAQAAELERLRAQVEETRRVMQQRIETDRAARVEAERRLDEAFARYESAIASGTPADIEVLRRQVEDMQIELRALQERERMNEQNLVADIERIRADIETARREGSPGVAALEAELARRQAQLDSFRLEREGAVARRTELERRHLGAISEGQRRRQEAEAEAEAMRRQIAEAQAAAQRASEAAQQAQQQAQQTAAELEKARQEAAQREQQRAAELEAARQELEKTRQELARREAEERSARMQAELAKLAATRRDERGLIVTLPGIFFDSGQSVLKAGAKRTLSRIAARLKGEANVRIAVEGHTDSVGSDESNRVLSEKRANAVRDYLVSEGVPADRIIASGKGEGEPVATNTTAAGRQQNRRVELIITGS